MFALLACFFDRTLAVFVLSDRFKLLYLEHVCNKQAKYWATFAFCPLISLFDLLNRFAIESVTNVQMMAQSEQIRQHRLYFTRLLDNMYRLIAFCRLPRNTYLRAMLTVMYWQWGSVSQFSIRLSTSCPSHCLLSLASSAITAVHFLALSLYLLLVANFSLSLH